MRGTWPPTSVSFFMRRERDHSSWGGSYDHDDGRPGNPGWWKITVFLCDSFLALRKGESVGVFQAPERSGWLRDLQVTNIGRPIKYRPGQ